MSLDKLKLEVMLSAIDKITRPLKAIQAGSSDTARALKAAREQLKDLNHAQENISSFQKLAKDAAITANTLKTAQAEVKRIKQEIDKVPVPTRDMARAFTQARDQAAKLKEEHSALIIRQQRLRDVLKNSGIETGQLGEKQRELKIQMAQATGEVGKQSAALEELNRRQKTLRAARADYDKTLGMRNKLAGAGASATAAGSAMGIPILKTIKDYAVAEDAATQLKVAMMGIGGNVPETFQRINDLAMQLGNKLPGTTTDYQNMMTMLIRQGMSAKAILGGLGQATAYLGVQLKMPMDAAAEFASKLQDATKTAEGDMMGLMDTIQRTYYLGVDSNNMLNAFSSLSSAMDTLKIKGLEGTKALAPLVVMLDQSSLVGESAGNALRKIFQRSLSISKLAKANEELSGTGIKLDFSNGKGEFGGLDKLFSQLAKLNTINTQKRGAVIKELYGDDDEVLKAISTILEKGKAGYVDVQARMAAQADIQRRVNEQLGTLKSLWDAASGTFTNALVALGEAIAPEVKAVVQWIGDLSEKLGNWSKENPILAHGMMKIAAITAISVTALGALTLAAAAVLGPLAALKLAMVMFPGAGSVLGWLNPLKLLGAAFNGIGTAIMWAGRALLMNPLGIGISAIALGAVLIYKYWGPIKEFFAGLWSGISTAAGPALQPLWNAFKSFATVLSPVFGWAIDTVSSLFGWLLKLIYPIESTGGAARSMGESVGMAVGNIISACLSIPTRFFELGANIMQGIGNGILSGLGYVKDALTGAGASMIGWFKEKLGIHSPSRVFAELGGFTMQGLTNGLQDGHVDAINSVKETAKKLTAIGAGIVLGGTAFAGQPAGQTDQVQPAREMISPSAAPSLLLDRTPLAQHDNGMLRDILDQSKLLLDRIAGGDMSKTLIDQSLATPPVLPLLQDQDTQVPRKDDALGNLIEQTKQLISRISGGAAGGAGSDQPIKWDNRPPIAPAASSSQLTQTFSPVFHIHPSPGMDEQQLAQLVAREVEKISRQQAANARSRLTDRE